MKSAFYAGTTGLIAQQEALNTIGNNLANSNTVGFKSQGVSFDDLLYTEMYANTPAQPQTGYGVKAVSTGLRLGQAPLRNTDSQLDFAIAGDGFFAVQGENGIEYTRDGAFSVRMDGWTGYLSTRDGRYVLDQYNRPIAIPRSDEKDSDLFDYEKLPEEIGVFRFYHPSALSPVSANRYQATALSGPARVSGEEENQLLQCCLENSGTSMADEMTDMIASQRAYQLCAQVIRTADENEQTINNLRK